MPVKHKCAIYIRRKLHKLAPKLVHGFEDPPRPDHIFKLPPASYKSPPGKFPIEKIILDPVGHMDVIGGPYHHTTSMAFTHTFHESPPPTTLAGESYTDTNFRVYYRMSHSNEDKDPLPNKTIDPATECTRLAMAAEYLTNGYGPNHKSTRSKRAENLRNEYPLMDSLASGYYHFS